MSTVRTIVGAWRVAASWLLMMALFLGPVGFGAAHGFAATSKTCDSSCPCDETPHQDSASLDSEDDHLCESPGNGAAATAEHDDDPRKDSCPADCPNCDCCLGIAMAVVPSLGTPSINATMSRAVRVITPLSAPKSGASTGVFRPPRSLT